MDMGYSKRRFAFDDISSLVQPLGTGGDHGFMKSNPMLLIKIVRKRRRK